MITNVSYTIASVSNEPDGRPSNSNPGALAASAVVKASAGTLYGGTITSTAASAQYIQFFNSTSVPANSTVPLISVQVPSNSTLAFNFGDTGRYFSTGIVVCNSSTVATKTLGSADCLFDIQYQ